MPKNNLKPKNLSKKPLSKKSSVWHFLKFKIQNSKFKISVQNSKIWKLNHWDLFKNWKLKIGNFQNPAALRFYGFKTIRVFAVLTVIALGGFVIWQSFLPQNARSKTFTMFQGAWNV